MPSLHLLQCLDEEMEFRRAIAGHPIYLRITGACSSISIHVIHYRARLLDQILSKARIRLYRVEDLVNLDRARQPAATEANPLRTDPSVCRRKDTNLHPANLEMRALCTPILISLRYLYLAD